MHDETEEQTMSEQTQAVPLTPVAAPNWRPVAALVVGVLAVSTAAIFIRLAQGEGAPSLVISATRLCVASLVLTPLVLRRYGAELRGLARADVGWALFGGLVLGVHFASWVSSLEYTAVVNSVTIVTTAPLWVAFMAPIFLRESLGRWAVFGLLFALTGGVLVSLAGDAGDPPTRNDPLLGNGLALVGAWMAAIYFMVGRQLRARLSVFVYIWLVYSAAAIILVVAVVLTGQPVAGLSAEAFLWMVLMGLIPQLLGHSAFNYALGFFPAAYVSLVVLAEPIGSGILAVIFLDEWPVALQLVGAALILVGIGFASREQAADPDPDAGAATPAEQAS